jgi:hypothetical protein
MKRPILSLGLALIALPLTSHAHRQWLLPSTTVLSGEDQWISVEGASSNNLFFPNHRPLRLESIVVKDPDGEPVELQHAVAGEIRTSFELKLAKQGTYAIAVESSDRGRMGGNTLFGTYEKDGKPQRWRGSVDELKALDLSTMPGFTLRERGSRTLITFVTCGAPTTSVLQPTGQGFEIEYLTHPNDLFHGESATFRLLINGQPAAGAEVTVVPGNDRFRNDPGELLFTSNEQGEVSIPWPAPGRYWLEASASAAGELHGVPSEKVSTYITTLEVLPE